ncbi:MAG: NnrS family protein [Burkholderiales bacterium]|nr:NnrS family protein [Burkholderiales bacterium]
MSAETKPTPAPAPAAPGLGWIKAAPHRLFFFLAILLLLTASIWWAAVLVLRLFGLSMPGAIAPTLVHATAMLYTFLPMYMFGFLFTAGPAWLAVKGPDAPALLATALLAFAGAAASIVLSIFSMPAAGIAALVLGACWARFLLIFGRLVRQSTAADRKHAMLVLAFMLPGVAGLAGYALLCISDNLRWFAWVTVAGLWWFVIPVFLVVVHRMLPFFTASSIPSISAWRPYWVLWCFLAASVGHGALELAGWSRYAWMLDAPAAVFLLWLGLRWGLLQSLRIRLLAMLHVGFVWLGIAYALYAADGILALMGARGFGLTPLHAAAMGFAATLMFAMVTRVTRGHSGRSLTADDATWLLFWLLQAATMLRLLSELWPQRNAWLVTAAILAWLATFASWAWKYVPVYLRPRADGKPG